MGIEHLDARVCGLHVCSRFQIGSLAVVMTNFFCISQFNVPLWLKLRTVCLDFEARGVFPRAARLFIADDVPVWGRQLGRPWPDDSAHLWEFPCYSGVNYGTITQQALPLSSLSLQPAWVIKPPRSSPAQITGGKQLASWVPRVRPPQLGLLPWDG